MQIHLIAVGKSMPAWINAGYHEYSQRLPSDYALTITEISPEKRTKSATIEKLIEKEEAKICAAIPKSAYVIAFDRNGKHMDTKTLAKNLQTWHDSNQTVCFIIGGPEGLSEPFLQRADAVWSLSELTLPHPLVRVVVAEQIYRAWSIIVNHPYHR